MLETPVRSYAIIGNCYLYDVATSTSGKFETRSNLNVLWFKSSTELGLQWGYSNSSPDGYTSKSIPLPSGRMNIIADYPKSLFNDVAEQLGSASPSSQSVGAPNLFAYNYSYTQRPSYSVPTSSGNKRGEYPTIAIFKKANNKRKRQTNAGNPAAKQKRGPYEPRQGAGPDFGLSIDEGAPPFWTTSFQWDSDRDCRAEDTVLSCPFPPGSPGPPLHSESAYCPSQQYLRA